MGWALLGRVFHGMAILLIRMNGVESYAKAETASQADKCEVAAVDGLESDNIVKRSEGGVAPLRLNSCQIEIGRTPRTVMNQPQQIHLAHEENVKRTNISICLERRRFSSFLLRFFVNGASEMLPANCSG